MAAPAKRIDGIDFWRGFALLTIFIDHVPENVFQHVTQQNFGFSDAAELFVFLQPEGPTMVTNSPSITSIRSRCAFFIELAKAAQLRISHRVHDVAVAEVVLQRASVDAIVGELEAAAGCVQTAHFRNGLLSVLGEIPQQRASHRLAQPVTRAAHSSGRVAGGL